MKFSFSFLDFFFFSECYELMFHIYAWGMFSSFRFDNGSIFDSDPSSVSIVTGGMRESHFKSARLSWNVIFSRHSFPPEFLRALSFFYPRQTLLTMGRDMKSISVNLHLSCFIFPPANKWKFFTDLSCQPASLTFSISLASPSFITNNEQKKK